MKIEDKILELVAKKKIIKAADLEAEGFSRNYLYTLRQRGLLTRVSTGTYALPGREITEYSSFAEITKQNPRVVICLLSALIYYQISTQFPHEVWCAIPQGANKPRINYPPLSLIYISEPSYSYGIQQHEIDGVQVNIYSIAKTVADCFRFRNKIGIDVAIEALKEAWNQKKVTMDELVEAAKINRVLKVMRPYMEVIV